MNHFKRSHWLLVCALACGLITLPAVAEDLLITNATLHAGDGSEPRDNMDIMIRDGRIDRIGEDLNIRGEVETIDAAGKPVTPGLFAGITNLGLVEVSAEAATVDFALAQGTPRPEFDVLPAYNAYATSVPITRIEGYTHAIIAPTASASFIAGQGRPITLAETYEPAIGPAILFVNAGADAYNPFSDSPPTSRAGKFMLMRQMFDEASRQALDNGSPHQLLTPQGRDALKQFMDGQGRVVFQADRASDIVAVLNLIDEFKLNGVIASAAEAWRVADRLAAAQVPVMINPLDNLPTSFDQIGARLDNAALLHEAGVSVSFMMAEFNTHNARKMRQMAGVAVAYGLPHAEGIKAITQTPTQIFGYATDRGTARRGNAADLVIWSGDPLEVTTIAEQVIIDGEPVEMTSRQTELRDRYLE